MLCINRKYVGFSLHTSGWACIGALLSICLVTQTLVILGSPVGLLNGSDEVAESESVSVDPSIPTSTPNTEVSQVHSFREDSYSVHRLPIFPTSVFHPPPLVRN